MEKIVCPKYKSSEGFEEVRCGIDAVSLITLDPQGDLQYEYPSITGSVNEQYYQCATCGYILDDVSAEEEFAG